MSNILGTQIVEEPAEFNWKPGVGGTTVRKFSGTQLLIEAKKAELELYGYETIVTQGPVWKLVATLTIDLLGNPNGDTGGGEQEPSPNWELMPQPIDQSLYESGRFPNIPTVIAESIEYKLKNPQNKDTFFYIPKSVALSNTIINTTDMLYGLRRLGIEHRRIYTLSLKRSIVVSSNFNSLSWTVNNVNSVLSTDRVSNTYNIQPYSLRQLLPPSGFENIVIDSTIYPQGLQAYFYYGWLELHPSFQVVAPGKVQVSQEWVYGKYSVTYDNNPGLYDVII